VVLYYLKKLFSSEVFLSTYLLLSPFFVATTYPSINTGKWIISSVLSIAIIFTLFKRLFLDFEASFSWNKYFTLSLLFYSWLMISTLLPSNQYNPFPFEAGDTSIRRARDVISIVIVYFCCFQLLQKKDVFKLLKIFYYTFYIALLGVGWNLAFDKYTLDAKVSKIHRLCSFMHDPNIFGLYLVLIIVLSYLFFLKETRRLARIKYVLICITAMGILYYTFSRSAMLTLALLIIVLFFTIKTRNNRRTMIVCLAAVAIIGVFLLQQRMQYLNVTKAKVDFSDFGRVSVGYAALNIIKEHWLIGVGFENGRFLVRRYENPRYPIDWNMVSIHNVYLAVTAELGIIGLLFLLTLYYFLLTDNIQLIRRYPFPQNLLFIFSFCVTITYLLHGVIYHIYFNNHEFYFFMLLNIMAIKYEKEVAVSVADIKL